MKYLILILSILFFAIDASAQSGIYSGARSRNIYGVNGASNIYGVRRRSGNVLMGQKFKFNTFGAQRSHFTSRKPSSGLKYYNRSAAGEGSSAGYEYHPMTEAERQQDLQTYNFTREESGEY